MNYFLQKEYRLNSAVHCMFNNSAAVTSRDASNEGLSNRSYLVNKDLLKQQEEPDLESDDFNDFINNRETEETGYNG